MELLLKIAFVWTPTATQAFEDLQQALTKMLVLQLLDFSLSFIIQTYNSNSGVGAILLQRGYPLAYFSKQLTPRLQASLTYARKMFSISESVKKWLQYLLRRRFTV